MPDRSTISLKTTTHALISGAIPPLFIRELRQVVVDADDETHIKISLDLIHDDSLHRPSFEDIQASLATIYVQAEREKTKVQKFLVQVEVFIVGFSHCSAVAIHQPSNSGHHTVALGGTFDHLHSGHKILLTMAAWLVTHRLIIGITDDILLSKKQFPSHIQPIAERTASILAFMDAVGPSDITLETPILQDVYGPTATDPNIQAIVVSRETVSGAEAINRVRKEKGFEPLQLYVIDVISPTQSNLSEQELSELKMSSTKLRRWLQHGT